MLAEQAAKEKRLATLSWIERPSKYREILDRSIGQLQKNYTGQVYEGTAYGTSL